ncbi:proline-rich protein 12-like isoform X2 [Peromyscus californicus insignis]|uniref:proline-rich protein 12-like isoform X2 n=1 Tax=Peromyscus californicus insignis TaxID=564181 RepID=UPI0022A7F63E|nr:proline-rich protein 12-like isoform X2 [Peromyscus californicus insignis]
MKDVACREPALSLLLLLLLLLPPLLPPPPPPPPPLLLPAELLGVSLPSPRYPAPWHLPFLGPARTSPPQGTKAESGRPVLQSEDEESRGLSGECGPRRLEDPGLSEDNMLLKCHIIFCSLPFLHDS